MNYSPQEIDELVFRVKHSNGVVLAKEEIFTPVPVSFARRTDLNVYEKMLYIYIWGFGIDNGQAFPGLRRMASDLVCSRPTIIKTLKSLEEKGGLITINRINKEKNENATNLYCLCRINTLTGGFDKDYLDLLRTTFPDRKVYI